MGFISSVFKWFFGDLENEDRSGEQKPILSPHNASRNGGPLSQELLISSPSPDLCSDRSPDSVLLSHTCLEKCSNSTSTDASLDENDLECQECLVHLRDLSIASDVLHDQNDNHSDSSSSDLLQQRALITSVSFLSLKDSTLHCTNQHDLDVARLQSFPDIATLFKNREFAEGKKQDRCPLEEQNSKVPTEEKQGPCLPDELHLEEVVAEKQNVSVREGKKKKEKQDACLVDNRELVEGKEKDRCPLDKQNSKVPLEKKQGASVDELHLDEPVKKKQNVSARRKRKKKTKQVVCLVNNREFVEAKKHPVDKQQSRVTIEKKGECLLEELHLQEATAKKQNVLAWRKIKKKSKQDVCLVNNREFVEEKKHPVDKQHSKVPIEKKKGECSVEELHLEEPTAKKQNASASTKRNRKGKKKSKQDVCLVNNREFVEAKENPAGKRRSKLPIEKKQGECLLTDVYLKEPTAKKQNLCARGKGTKQDVCLVNNRESVEAKKKDGCLVDEQHFEVPVKKKKGTCLPKELQLEEPIGKKPNLFVREKWKEKKKQDVCLDNNREFVKGNKQDKCPLQHSEVPIENKQVEKLIEKNQNVFAREKRKKKVKQDVCLVNNREFVEAKDRCQVDERHPKVPIDKKQGKCIPEELHPEKLTEKKQNVLVREKTKEKESQDICLVNNRESVEGSKQDRCPLYEQHPKVPIEKKEAASLLEEILLGEPITNKQNGPVRKRRKRKKKQDVCLVNNREFVEEKKQDRCPVEKQHSKVPIGKKEGACLQEELHVQEQIRKKQDVFSELPIEKKQGECLLGDLHSEEQIEVEVIKGVLAEERWIKHYSSFQKILLVGEGDFSFSASLANAFGSANNMIATSLDSRDAVIRKYKNAKSNLKKLKQLGACVLHAVDATKMKLHTDLQTRKFDRIIFNFPHAGFHGSEIDPRLIKKHRKLVRGFFKNSCSMLRADGEVHVSHKTAPPYCNWNLEELAGENSLSLTERADFKIQDYPGYGNKRGDGLRCDESFRLGKSSTFKFISSVTSSGFVCSLDFNCDPTKTDKYGLGSASTKKTRRSRQDLQQSYRGM